MRALLPPSFQKLQQNKYESHSNTVHSLSISVRSDESLSGRKITHSQTGSYIFSVLIL